MKGAIFDLDGTLLDSMKYWGEVVPKYLESKGLKMDARTQQDVDSMTLMQTSSYLKKKYNLEDSEEKISIDTNLIIENDYKFNIPLKPYVRTFLDQMKKRNIKMCIATATDSHLVMYAIKRLRLEEYFEFIITTTEVGISKGESAKIFNDALLKLNTKKEKTYIFEDAPFAVKNAYLDHFKVVGIYDDYYKEFHENMKKRTVLFIDNFKKFDFSLYDKI